jgi:hypothetical protein
MTPLKFSILECQHTLSFIHPPIPEQEAVILWRPFAVKYYVITGCHIWK